jgi:hypothetical protein
LSAKVTARSLDDAVRQKSPSAFVIGHATWKISRTSGVAEALEAIRNIVNGTRQDGCLVEVAIVPATAAEMERALELYLQSCQLGTEIFRRHF